MFIFRTAFLCLLYVAVVRQRTSQVAGLQCSPGGCGDRLDCPSVVDCPGGTTSDQCGCCLECARVANETCGGRYRAEGKCDDGLVCVIMPVPGSVITGEEVGICKVIPAPSTSASVLGEDPDVDVHCNAVDCDSLPVGDQDVGVLVCPPDSVPAPRPGSPAVDGGGGGLCCPRRRPQLACRCLPCGGGEPPACGPGEVRVLRSEGTPERPGQCCDVYECVDHATFCSDVQCADEDYDDVTVTCPADSYRPPTLVTQDGCCLVEQGCRCKGPESCVEITCPDGQQKRVRQLATGLPGSCCNTYDCINGSVQMCYHNGTQRPDGATWRMDDCTTCTCQDGLSFCEPMHCPQLTRCGWIGHPDDSCCPVCKGCVSQAGELKENGVVWQQDSCVTCRCDDGQTYCQAQMCSIGCINPHTVPGECCPVCDDTLTVTLAPHCPSLSNCKLMCSNGYVRSANGCYQCHCVEPTDEPCQLDSVDCPNGFRRDILGLEVCDCADAPPLPTPAEARPSASGSDPTVDAQPTTAAQVVAPIACAPMTGCGKQCLYGYRLDRYGCPRCRCNKCPPFDCAKKCRDGFAHGPDGCKLCRCLDATFFDQPTTPGESITTTRSPSVLDNGRQCVSADGRRTIEDGQSWWDGCRRCFCREGHEMCALISCPVLRCINPVIRSDSCCPTCPGDVSLLPFGTTSLCHLGNGHYYADGDTWQLDDCTLCICHQGTPLCIVDSCPPTLCNHPIVIPRLCCPVCPDEDGFLPTSALVPLRNSPKPCRSALTGTRYVSGDTWRVDACQSCACRDGQIVCFAQTCPILSCNKSVLKKGHCCPVCAAGLGSSVEFCSYGGDIYGVGESWLVDECTHCTCADGGQVLCTITVCDPQQAHCAATDTRSIYGVCCPICHNVTSSIHAININFTGGDVSSDARTHGDGTNSSPSTTTIILIFFVALLSLLVLLLAALLYSRRLRHIIYHSHRPSIAKSSAPSSPLAPPRYVAASQLSSVVDCADLDLELQRRWVSGLPPAGALLLKPPGTDLLESCEESSAVDPTRSSGSEDSLHKPPLVDVVATADSTDCRSSPAPEVDSDVEDSSCERLSTLDCDTVDDDYSGVEQDTDDEPERQTPLQPKPSTDAPSSPLPDTDLSAESTRLSSETTDRLLGPPRRVSGSVGAPNRRSW